MNNTLGKYNVNMESYRNTGAKFYSGRPSGKQARKELNLEKLEDEYDVLIFRFPDDTLSVNPSFFLGMFGESVRKFGEEVFRSKFKFDYKKEVISKNIDQGIFNAINE